MLQTIEIPFLFPFLGILIILIFGYNLFKINRTLNEIKKNNLIHNIEDTDKKSDNKDDLIKNIKVENLITSPMVGIVYLNPDSTKPPFVNEGDHVKQGDTVALIEAMKTFNNVRAPRSGVIKKILISSSTPVEYGEKLMIID